MAVYITGDTHGYIDIDKLSYRRWPESRHLTDNDYLIICGDFGLVWGGSQTEDMWLEWFDNKPYTTLFCLGNHENYDLIKTYPIIDYLGGKVRQISEKVFCLMNGESYIICGKKFFVMGGASSHDISDGILEQDDPDFAEKYVRMSKACKLFRVNHVSWWKEEIPSKEEFEHGIDTLEKNNYQFDYIISHCAPNTILDKLSMYFYNHDVLTDWLDENVFKKCIYKAWYFGHYHEDKTFAARLKNGEAVPHTCLYYDIVKLEDME